MEASNVRAEISTMFLNTRVRSGSLTAQPPMAMIVFRAVFYSRLVNPESRDPEMPSWSQYCTCPG